MEGHPPVLRPLLAIATCGRPVSLRACLESVAAVAPPPRVELQVLLVDNNAEPSAHTLVDELAAGFPHPLHFVHEPERGIVRARNRAVAEALARGADALAFLDDDTEVAPDWLSGLLSVLDDFGADVAAGPAIMVWPRDCPAWLPTLLEPKARATGLEERPGFEFLPATRNVLFRIRLIDAWGLRFHPDLNLTGGSDTLFFAEARARGARIAWAADAPVRERFPASRATLSWFLLRRFRHGMTRVRFRQLLGEDLSWRQWFEEALGPLHEYWCRVPWELLALGNHDFLRWVRQAGDMADSLGGVLSSLGLRYQEYSRIHGG